MPDPARILIADAAPVAERFARILQKARHHTTIAGGIEAALAALDDTPNGFDLILIDFDLAPAAALDRLRKLRERHRDVLPIVTTAFGQVNYVAAAIKLGAEEVLVKPVTEQVLLRAVEAAAAKQVLLQGTVDDDTTLAAGLVPALAPPEAPGQARRLTTTHGGTGTLAEALLGPERRIIRDALDGHGWNRNATAAALGIDRTTLYKKIKRFGLDRPG